MNLKLKLITLFTALVFSAVSEAKLHCPSVSEIRRAQMTEVRPTCNALTMSCSSYASYGFINHNGEVWAVGTGEFSAGSAISDGQDLLAKAEKPFTTKKKGIEFCVYYYSFWADKYVGAIPQANMPYQFSLIELLK